MSETVQCRVLATNLYNNIIYIYIHSANYTHLIFDNICYVHFNPFPYPHHGLYDLHQIGESAANFHHELQQIA